jgi:6-pyruvoyltetrahydropterin/6-carboxytetrahydropterin synthase
MELLVVKEFTFDAAHYLPNHPGKCAMLHGHTYKLQIGIKGPIDIETGMVIDFGNMKEVVKKLIIDKLDHSCLNELTGFPNIPSAENMVEWVVHKLNSYLENEMEGLVMLHFVRLYETPTSYAEWRA